MHPLNPYLTKRPDFAHLASRHPTFAPFVNVSDTGYASINFQDPAALRALTAALLKEDWGYDVELREDRLCPTIGNRLDYLYHILDIKPYLPGMTTETAGASSSSEASTLVRRPIKVLDIGTGHIAIYPLLLHRIRPSAQIVATELDAVSFHHSIQTRLKNDIPSTSISIRRPIPEQPILFPIFDEIAEERERSKASGEAEAVSVEVTQTGWDFVMCNPPFFGSEEEMRLGKEGKAGVAPAAPTGAANELITPGGEVEFVSKMIRESVQLGAACQWYTSLIGKYSSLSPLVEQLKRDKIDNYFIKICRQARTTRWILGWSHTATRLPDSITRTEIIPGTALARLLPPPNSSSHTPINPSIPCAELRQRIEAILRDVSVHFLPITSHLSSTDVKPSTSTSLSTDPAVMSPTTSTSSASTGAGSISIAPLAYTWSRAARRLAARATGESLTTSTTQPIFRAEINFMNANRPDILSATVPAASVEDVGQSSSVTPVTTAKEGDDPDIDAEGREQDVAEGAEGETEKGGTVEMRWLEGKDRVVVESLWKYVLSKAGLVGGR